MSKLALDIWHNKLGTEVALRVAKKHKNWEKLGNIRKR